MTEKIHVPDIGDFKDVEVIEVLIAVGDSVTAEQSILTLESDKATMDVPSPATGIIREIYINAGDKVNTGSLVAAIENTAATAATEKETDNSAQDETELKPEPAAAKPDTPEPEPATATTAAAEEVRVPNIGDFDNVEIIEMLVKVGDTVQTEQSLLTLESDKATMDIPAPCSGRIENLYVSNGDKVSEGSLIAAIATSAGGNDMTAAAPEPVSTPPAATIKTAAPRAATPANRPPPLLPSAPETQSAKPYAGPAVRRFARELGVDLTAVRGSGRSGRIRKEDVTTHVKTRLTQQQPDSGFSAFTAVAEIDFRQFGEIEMQPLSRINKLSAAALHRNWVAAPHVTQFAEADITDMEAFRQSLAEEAKKSGYKMTPLAFLIKAAVTALREFPKFNTSLLPDGETLALKKYYHIGVAVDTPNGLVVPVVRDAERKGLSDIARELADISQRARDGALKREDMQGGCFTISSLGGIGGSAFTPILNLPEVAILGVSRSSRKPVWDNTKNEFIPRLMLPLSLSYDHRVIDGAAGARFISLYCDLLGDIRRLTL